MSPYLSFFLAIVFAMICAYVAKKRSRNPILWFIAGFLFTVFALLILMILPSKTEQTVDTTELKANLAEMQELEKTESIAPEKEPMPENLADKLWYYLDANNNQCGPMTMQGLMSEWKEGKIKGDTFVWNEELSDWKPLQETSDFQLFQEKRKES